MEITDRDSQEKRTAPTVTKEKWVSHAIAKLSRGYVLIVGNGRKSANFYLPGKGYEMCAYDAASRMVKMGLVEKAFDHYLGTAYRLSPSVALPDRPAIRHEKDAEPEPEGEVGALLDDLATDEGDDVDVDEDISPDPVL